MLGRSQCSRQLKSCKNVYWNTSVGLVEEKKFDDARKWLKLCQRMSHNSGDSKNEVQGKISVGYNNDNKLELVFDIF